MAASPQLPTQVGLSSSFKENKAALLPEAAPPSFNFVMKVDGALRGALDFHNMQQNQPKNALVLLRGSSAVVLPDPFCWLLRFSLESEPEPDLRSSQNSALIIRPV